MRAVLYALGKKFEQYRDVINWKEVIAVSDGNESKGKKPYPVPFLMPDQIFSLDYDYVVIFSDRYFDEARMRLSWECGIPAMRIVSWRAVFQNGIDKERLVRRWLKTIAKEDERKEVLDLGRLGLVAFCLTKEDIGGTPKMKLCGLDDGSSIINVTLYDEVFGLEDMAGHHFDYALMGSPMDFDATAISKFSNQSDCLIFISSWKEDMKNHGYYKKMLSRFGRASPIAMAEGILWMVDTAEAEKQASDIAVYVVTHKPYHVKDEFPYVPLCVGGYFRTGWLSEDRGDNISHLNPKLNECTAMYWIWKNTSSKYVGLNHYRRYFFRSDILSADNFLDGRDIEKWLQEYDMILPETWITEQTVEEVMRESIDNELFEIGYRYLRQALGKHQMNYLQALDRVMEGHVLFRCNMFIMKKEIFDRYCMWLFSFLIEAAEAVEVEGYDDYSKRIMGFFAERMLTVWLWNNKYRIKQLPIVVPSSLRK